MFDIDTGLPKRDPAQAWAIDKRDTILSGVLDALPENATQAQIDNAMVLAVLGELHKPKLAGTMRKHFRALWPLLAPIADRDPNAFDGVMIAYAERITELPADQSEAIARRQASAAIR